MDLILSFLYGYSVIHIPFIKKSIFSPMTWVTVLTWNKFLFASESISRLLFCSTGLSLHVPVLIDLVTQTSYFLISNSVKPPSSLFFYRIFQALFEIITIMETHCTDIVLQAKELLKIHFKVWLLIMTASSSLYSSKVLKFLLSLEEKKKIVNFWPYHEN